VRAPPPALAIPAILLNACGAAPSGPAAENASAADRNAAEYRAAAEEARVNSQPADPGAVPPAAGEPRVDALLAALAARDEAGARRLVGDVGYIVATNGIVSSEDAFIARVLGCETADIRTVNAPVRYRVVWDCPDGAGHRLYYNAAIATSPPFAAANGPVAILEFSAGRTNPALGRRHPPPTATRPPGD
jgi:hypothetical protein